MSPYHRALFSAGVSRALGVSGCLVLIFWSVWSSCAYAQTPARSAEYDALQKGLASGWNTWDVHSVTTHVLLPEGLAIRIGVHHKTTLYTEAFLSDALIGRQGQNDEKVFPGPHAWEGSYTNLGLNWQGVDLQIESAHAGPDLVVLVTPLSQVRAGHPAPTVVFSAAYLWNRPGSAARVGNKLEARSAQASLDIYSTARKHRSRAFRLPLRILLPNSTARSGSALESRELSRKFVKRSKRSASPTSIRWARRLPPHSTRFNLRWGGTPSMSQSAIA